MTTVLVAGASLAGLTAVTTLRDAGYDDHIVVVDPSPRLPPDRPPLSKQVLAGAWAPERAVHRNAQRLPELSVDLRLGVGATGLDASTRRVTLSDGDAVDADGVLLAVGAEPRHLGGDAPGGVHVLRTMEDCLSLRADLEAGPDRVVVVGAGFIGAEVAATCVERGLAVTMIEAGPVPLGRVLPAQVGGFVTELHRGRGVDVRVDSGVSGFEADDDGRVRRVLLSDGTAVDAQVVVVGIGVVPSVGWLTGSGLDLDDGIGCDETLLAAPGIVGAGDAASWPNRRFGEVMRVEQWENAIEQGEHAARRLLVELAGEGVPEPFAPVPWFWSDQYDRKLQLAGRPSGDDEVHLVEGSFDEQRFVVLFRRGDRCTGVLGVNRPRHVMQARMQLAEALDWAPVAAIFE